MKKIGFIGCGNMGAALARAAAKSVGAENKHKIGYFCNKVAEILIRVWRGAFFIVTLVSG